MKKYYTKKVVKSSLTRLGGSRSEREKRRNKKLKPRKKHESAPAKLAIEFV